MPIDGTMLGNVFRGGSYFKGKTLKSRFLCPFFFLLSSFLSLSLFLTLSPSLSLFLTLSHSLSLSLSPSLSLSLSYGFCLDRVLADVTKGFANCNF